MVRNRKGTGANFTSGLFTQVLLAVYGSLIWDCNYMSGGALIGRRSPVGLAVRDQWGMDVRAAFAVMAIDWISTRARAQVI